MAMSGSGGISNAGILASGAGRDRPSRSRRVGAHGMSFVGLMLSLAAVGVLLGAAVVVSDTLRIGTADRDTRVTLRRLHDALAAYSAGQGQPPPEPTEAALRALLGDEAAGPMVLELSMTVNESGTVMIRDGYGRAVHYTDEVPAGDFVSAGPDGVLGDADSSDAAIRQAAADDVYGSDVENSG